MSAFTQRTEPLNAVQIMARVQLLDGQGSGLDADLVRGLGPDSSPFVAGGMVGIVGFGQSAPKSRFQGCVYPTAFLGV